MIHCFDKPLAHHRSGIVQRLHPDETLFGCDVCKEPYVKVLRFDTSYEEYGSMDICQKCLNSFFEDPTC